MLINDECCNIINLYNSKVVDIDPPGVDVTLKGIDSHLGVDEKMLI